MSAAIKVLHTAELLEQILIRVTDTKTLLLSQRVDKFWNSVISSTATLQKKLFFVPATHNDLTSLCMLADELVDGGYEASDFVKFSGRRACHSPSTSFALLNPFIISRISWPSYLEAIDLSTLCQNNSLTGGALPSLTRMMVTQPPIPDFHIIGTTEKHIIKAGTVQQILVAFEELKQLEVNRDKKLRTAITAESAMVWDYKDALQREQSALPEEVQYEDSDSYYSDSGDVDEGYDYDGIDYFGYGSD